MRDLLTTCKLYCQFNMGTHCCLPEGVMCEGTTFSSQNRLPFGFIELKEFPSMVLIRIDQIISIMPLDYNREYTFIRLADGGSYTSQEPVSAFLKRLEIIKQSDNI